MDAYLPTTNCREFLAEELQRMGLTPQPSPLSDVPWLFTEGLPSSPYLAFARQTLPACQHISGVSINGWADLIITRIIGEFTEGQPWRLHLWPAYGEGRAGLHRCDLIHIALVERLKKRRRALLRSLEESHAPFTPTTSLVQVALSAPDAGLLSVSVAPQPVFTQALVSPFIAGDIPHAEDKAAPSRAFAKVIESELRLGQQIERGQTCVDLGAAPGSWSYVALQRGAHVIAVDRSPLRDDLMRSPCLTFHQADAFKFRLTQPVDWLICDIIAAPQRSIDLLLDWLRAGLMRRFIVTLKFKGADEYALLDQLKEHAPSLCADFRLTRLCANKNEVCAFGVVAEI